MGYIPKKGDMVWLDFTPQSGHEQKGRRPAIVISNDFFNNKTGLAVVCPITSSRRDYPLHVEISGCKKVTGYIMVEQVKSVDYLARGAELIERAPETVINETLSRFFACF
ncbi:mRNA-degrading endonuclease [Thermanaerosceptrum fracticalcis]|jgi:mRNA interferase MazF|uniref:mRNA-degrading endonuclease n=1 Tax=Thermanaerosceptrum fracticalcis TaxID=1712410 RepID=A0A7G6DYK1_THEFR|nr:type II toxin-antitoxin system PemK/MazF family toxin [Thermanaerosceptrum fracticalcis]QNB44905.1 mRNA-degrading endonuclease [Thermanaerosceptrum fracticalcis]